MNANRIASRIPWTVVVATVCLVTIGISAIARGDELFQLGEFAPRQRMWTAIAIGVFVAASIWPYQRLKWLSYSAYLGCLLLLLFVFWMPAKNGAHRWIPLGLMDFQPSEVTKLALILALARYLMHRESFRTWYGLAMPLGLTLLPMGLVLKEPDLGTSLVFIPVLFAMLFAAGAKPKHLVAISLLGVLASPLLWMQMSAEQKSRVVTVFRQKSGGDAPDDDGYHLHQSKRLLSAGGVWGSWLTDKELPDRRAYHLPESRTDFVFCLIGERWGLLGCLVTLLLYCALIGSGLMIAAQTREPFGRLIAVGIASLIATQMLINTGMTVGLLPITGMTLPLTSYGGSSLLATSLALGLLVNVALHPTEHLHEEPFAVSSAPIAVS